MSTFFRLLPVVTILAMVLLYVGCSSTPPVGHIQATHIGNGVYVLAIGDTGGGSGRLDTLYMAAVGDTPGGSGGRFPCTDPSSPWTCPPYIEFVDDSNAAGPH